jgi:hypothetical protein
MAATTTSISNSLRENLTNIINNPLILKKYLVKTIIIVSSGDSKNKPGVTSNGMYEVQDILKELKKGDIFYYKHTSVTSTSFAQGITNINIAEYFIPIKLIYLDDDDYGVFYIYADLTKKDTYSVSNSDGKFTEFRARLSSLKGSYDRRIYKDVYEETFSSSTSRKTRKHRSRGKARKSSRK